MHSAFNKSYVPEQWKNLAQGHITSYLHFLAKSMWTPYHDTHMCLLYILFQRHGVNTELTPFTAITTSSLIWKGFSVNFTAWLWRFVLIHLQEH